MANFQDSFAEVAIGCMYAGANALSSLLLQCLWESFALPVIVTPLVEALTADQPAVPSQPMSGQCSVTTATFRSQQCMTGVAGVTTEGPV